MKLKTAAKCALLAIGLPLFFILWILNIDNSIVMHFLKDIKNDLNKYT